VYLLKAYTLTRCLSRPAYASCKQSQVNNREKASQTVFAAYLNLTPGLVSKWERGEKRPKGPSLKLLSLVDKKGLEIIA
jgi:putative transcriptional regulator